MPPYQVAVIALIYIIILLLFILLLHLTPINFRSIDRHPVLAQFVLNVPTDSNFQVICQQYCELTDRDVARLHNILTNPYELRIQADYWFRNGWIGMRRGEDFIGLALPARWPAFFLWTATVHELFHLVRHVQGVRTGGRQGCTFDWERRYYVLDPRRMVGGFVEEWIIWRKTARVDQIGTVTILTVLLSFPVMYGMTFWYTIQPYLVR
jgi:hypothetical protein